MTREIEIFKDYLKRKSLKLTGQREEVLRAFLSCDRHLSSDDLYNLLKKKNPSIGHATVFRTLKLLCEAGLANQVNLGDKHTRFEHKYEHAHHDHLVCVKCGSAIEVTEPKIEELQNRLCKKFGFSPAAHRLEIFGLCKKCK